MKKYLLLSLLVLCVVWQANAERLSRRNGVEGYTVPTGNTTELTLNLTVTRDFFNKSEAGKDSKPITFGVTGRHTLRANFYQVINGEDVKIYTKRIGWDLNKIQFKARKNTPIALKLHLVSLTTNIKLQAKPIAISSRKVQAYAVTLDSADDEVKTIKAETKKTESAKEQNDGKKRTLWDKFKTKTRPRKAKNAKAEDKKKKKSFWNKFKTKPRSKTADKLKELKSLRDQGLITEKEYQAKRKKYVDSL